MNFSKWNMGLKELTQTLHLHLVALVILVSEADKHLQQGATDTSKRYQDLERITK
jgi:hypothetical protein